MCLNLDINTLSVNIGEINATSFRHDSTNDAVKYLAHGG
jgi:hypothetical protein